MPNLSALYKTKKIVKKSPTKLTSSEAGVEFSGKKKLSLQKFVNPRAFLNGWFPEENDARYFDKLERIQKLMMIDTTPDVLQMWGVGNFSRDSCKWFKAPDQ